MPISDANNYRFNPLYITKVWSLKDYPKQKIGLIVLNRDPNNYFVEVEQDEDLYRIMGEAEKARLVYKITSGLS